MKQTAKTKRNDDETKEESARRAAMIEDAVNPAVETMDVYVDPVSGNEYVARVPSVSDTARVQRAVKLGLMRDGETDRELIFEVQHDPTSIDYRHAQLLTCLDVRPDGFASFPDDPGDGSDEWLRVDSWFSRFVGSFHRARAKRPMAGGE